MTRIPLPMQIERAKAHIAHLEIELDQSRLALQSLEETNALTTHIRMRGNESLVVEVNGIELPVGAKQATIIDVLRQLDDDSYCPGAVLKTITGGTKQNMTGQLFKLRRKLKRAGVDIVFFKGPGKGYRLQPLQAQQAPQASQVTA